MKRGTEDLDFFIGDEALAAANGPGTHILEGWLRDCSNGSGYGIHYPIRHGQVENWVNFYDCLVEAHKLMCAGSYGEILVEFYIQVPSS